MSDRIAEIREAIRRARIQGSLTNANFNVLVNAAEERLALLDSDALIIRRDRIDYGKASNVLRRYVRETTISFSKLAEEVVDAALASSQGVEPWSG